MIELRLEGDIYLNGKISKDGKRRPKMIGNDKVLHFLAGLSIAALLGVFLPARWPCLAQSLRGAKELKDLKTHKPEVLDLLATAAGGLIAICL